MSAIYDDENFLRDAELAAEQWFRQHGHQPVTEELAAQWLEEAPRPPRYTGRRRANEDGTPSLGHVRTVADLLGDYRCVKPDEHAVDYPDGPVAWIQHRKATWECLTCKGRVR